MTISSGAHRRTAELKGLLRLIPRRIKAVAYKIARTGGVPASPVDDVDKTTRASEAAARAPVKAGRRPHSHNVPVKPSAPRVARAKADASGKDPTMRFSPLISSSLWSVYWAFRMNPSSHWVPVKKVAASSTANSTLAAAYATSALVIVMKPAWVDAIATVIVKQIRSATR